jgi:fido (protein-threonine AMPylation protein)
MNLSSAILPRRTAGALADAAGFWTSHSYGTSIAGRLVVVHPFPNGNGRWSRLAGDLLIVQQGGHRFTWGRTSLQPVNEARLAYIDALRAADSHDIEPLVAFARS